MAAVDNPVSTFESGNIILRNVAFACSGQTLEIAVSGGRISGIRKLDAPAEWICLPALVDKHVHANRAFTLTGVKPDSIRHAVALTAELLRDFRAEQYCAHARQLFETARSHGTTGIRTHADIDRNAGFNALQGTLDARAGMAGDLDVAVDLHQDEHLAPDQASVEYLAEGDPADLVLVKGRNFDDILSQRPPDRITFHRGNPCGRG
ncbi:MAG: hypothetical protein OXG54_05280 [Gammaproteobacteria bacterium]|nr:hypothetical protein [Gammaproteobacteria bacterium]